MEFIREDCIYARQSVDRKDSISIESQIDFCKYELKGGSCRVFKDKGYSGKNTDRPEFQKLLGEIRKGKVRRVIVYKLDRISRSIQKARIRRSCANPDHGHERRNRPSAEAKLAAYGLINLDEFDKLGASKMPLLKN